MHFGAKSHLANLILAYVFFLLCFGTLKHLFKPLWEWKWELWKIDIFMAIHSSTLAWKIPWTEEPDRLQSVGSQRVGHDWATSFHFTLCCVIRILFIFQWSGWRLELWFLTESIWLCKPMNLLYLMIRIPKNSISFISFHPKI